MFPSGHYPTMDSRFRSPVVPRKGVGSEDAATSLAKKSKRSKSTENSLEKSDPFMRMAARDKTEPEDPMSVLNKRWSIIAKNQETMSKQELLNNYRLLMNDHLRLERFLSIVTKDNELARHRLETDLLDAMMCIEDLKQALEVRMARRRKIVSLPISCIVSNPSERWFVRRMNRTKAA
ncbi:unnamed protein product [Hydatigera taeniaeformis]|uniref:Uncharacterized protein n=1 Tax=Hydatigena taeniaeformis TaxID=6205 RepID=A0A0R3X682_HYDTA|nr:unnamed protein product [Hydatigera taeniaeformis]